jgi:hypothetical protein
VRDVGVHEQGPEEVFLHLLVGLGHRLLDGDIVHLEVVGVLNGRLALREGANRPGPLGRNGLDGLLLVHSC